MIRTPSHPIHHSRLVSRSPIFYGWVVWLAATVGLLATAPGQSFSVSLFMDYFIAEFGISRTVVSSLFGLGTFMAAFSVVWVGRRIDRYGSRRVSAVVSMLFALVLSMLAYITGPLGLLLAFIAIRSLGQGALALSSTTVIAQWFRRRRGRVFSLSMLAFALFQGAYVPWLQEMLALHGWRVMWGVLGAGVALTALPAALLLLRDKPEDFGLRPDGQALRHTPPPQAAEAETPDDEDNWTLAETLRTPIFWIFITGRVIAPAWGTGLILHQISVFNSVGHSPAVAAQAYGSIAVVTAVFSLLSGVLIDRLRPGLVLSLQSTMLLLSCLLASVMSESWLLLLYVLSFGMVMGIGGVFDSSVWTNVFGRRHQGSIRGLVTTILIIATSVGPILFGLSYDYLGSYGPVLWLGALLAAVPAVLALFAHKPAQHPVIRAAGD